MRLTKEHLIVLGTIAVVIIVGGVLFFLTHEEVAAPVIEEPPTLAAPAPLPLPSSIEVADTSATREQGLSGRTQLGEDYGMLFIFPYADRYGFWMKDMTLTIDIIWMNEDGRIITIEENVPADSYPEVFYPVSNAKYVLETRAGYASEHGYREGVRLDLSSYIE